jgi:hypothetical protein
VKVSPSNQTLILAGDREAPRTTQGAHGAAGSVYSSAARTSVTRVTVYSARLDEIVTGNQNAAQYDVTQHLLTEPEVGRFIDVFA